MLFGTPLDERRDGREYPLSGIDGTHLTASGAGILLRTTLFDDGGEPGYLDLARPGEIDPVAGSTSTRCERSGANVSSATGSGKPPSSGTRNGR